MLTPIELQGKSFKSGGLGYDKKDVDQFFREVNENYTRLYRENIDLRDKVDVLNDALQQYKAMEKTLQRALILAEKTAEDTKEAAIKSARNIEKEAVMKSQILMADARNELEHIHARTLELLKQFDRYKAQFKSLAAAQIELLESESYSINAANLEAFSQMEIFQNSEGALKLEGTSKTEKPSKLEDFLKTENFSKEENVSGAEGSSSENLKEEITNEALYAQKIAKDDPEGTKESNKPEEVYSEDSDEFDFINI